MAKDYEEMRYEMRTYSTKFSKCPEKDFDVGYRCAVYDGGSWWREYYVWIISQRATFFLLTCHIYVTFTTPPPP